MARKTYHTIHVSRELSERDLDRLCDLFELLDKWDRESQSGRKIKNRADRKRRPTIVSERAVKND